MLSVDNDIPTFTLRDQSGNTVDSTSLFAGGPLVLYFYPKDNTPICTKQACSFRDAYESFTAAGATVVGVSSDDGETHEKFATNHRLPFQLLTDVGNKVRKLFGVSKTFGILPGRVTFVIDKHGVVRHTFSSQLQAQKHVDEALTVVKELSADI